MLEGASFFFLHVYHYYRFIYVFLYSQAETYWKFEGAVEELDFMLHKLLKMCSRC